jgi:preprotein translocase subunit SecE
MMKNMQVFLQEVKLEFSKIIWPKPEALAGALVVVLILVIAFSLYIGAIDFIFYKAINYILSV